ncbi:hypothetical protein BJX65DRAFT_153196 [Aspergillus insuetus]
MDWNGDDHPQDLHFCFRLVGLFSLISPSLRMRAGSQFPMATSRCFWAPIHYNRAMPWSVTVASKIHRMSCQLIGLTPDACPAKFTRTLGDGSGQDLIQMVESSSHDKTCRLTKWIRPVSGRRLPTVRLDRQESVSLNIMTFKPIPPRLLTFASRDVFNGWRCASVSSLECMLSGRYKTGAKDGPLFSTDMDFDG